MKQSKKKNIKENIDEPKEEVEKVATRRSTRSRTAAAAEATKTLPTKQNSKEKKVKDANENKQEEEKSATTSSNVDVGEVGEVGEVGAEPTTPPTTKKSKKQNSKKLKSERKAELRKKQLGIGIGKIDVNAPSKGKKTTFDDDFVADDISDDDKEEEKEPEEEGRGVGEMESDDDDEIEQVTATAAKNEALQIRAAERETRKVENALTQKRKRKKKDVEKEEEKADLEKDNKDDDDDELDEEFFAMVDTAREDDSRIKKLKKESTSLVQKLGKHTTFVSEENEPGANNPIHTDHNIELVVLPSSNTEENDDQQVSTILKDRAAAMLSSGLSTIPSNEALSLCRGRHSLKRVIKKPGQKQPMKRSRSMKYRFRAGKASPAFLVQKRRKKSTKN